MKSTKFAFTLSTLLLAGAANADILGANAEAGIFDGDDGSATYASIDVQHPIPLIPNLRIDVWDFESDPSGTDISHLDFTGYYGVGILWASIEGGVTFRSLDMDRGASSDSESVPMLFLAASLAIPGTGVTLAAESKSISSFDDVTITDQSFKIQYQPIPVLGLEVGYRSIDQETNFLNKDYDGYFIGVTLDI
jgi:outer membrane protein|tara:strand:- start:2216 stop:2794 length:579 start_codon:yes stop_codon:yes gene_type:complete